MKVEHQKKCDSCDFITINKKSFSNHVRFGCNKGIKWHKKDYQDRKDYWKGRSKKRYELKKEEINEKRRLRYRLNPNKEKDKMKEYLSTDKAKAMRKAVWHRYRSKKIKGNVTTDQINELFKNQKNCIRCTSIEYLEIDHIIPLSKGGHHSIENLQLLCRKCNRSKGNKICLN